jgi:hypothetical protein
MPPKAKPVAASPHIYVVTHNKAVDSVYASAAAANERAAAMKAEESEAGSIKVEPHQLKGGSVQVSTAVEDNKAAPRGKAPKTAEVEAAKAKTAAKKTRLQPNSAPRMLKSLTKLQIQTFPKTSRSSSLALATPFLALRL